MTWEIPGPMWLQFNARSPRAIPGGLEPALGTVLKCEIFGHYGRLWSGGPMYWITSPNYMVPPNPSCTHEPLQVWGPLTSVLPPYLWSVFWVVLSFCQLWNSSVSSLDTRQHLGGNGKREGDEFGFHGDLQNMRHHPARRKFPTVVQWKAVWETLQSLLHRQ